MIGRRTLVAAATLAPTAVRAQRYYDRGRKMRTVRFAGSGGATLEGTLLLPIKSELQYVPGVVLIAGSGPTDRDGNNPFVPARIDLLKQLAELLADVGIASLRYDKRGIGASTHRAGSLEQEERFFAWANFVSDVRAAHAELLRHDEIKKYATGFVGHSEGGLLALAAAAEMSGGQPHALVLLSTPGRPLRDIVHDQVARNGPAFVPEVDRILAEIARTGRVPTGISPELQPLFPIYGGPFFQGALPFDPAATLARLDTACLVLQGGGDTQVVPPGDIQPLIDGLAGRGSASGEVVVVPAVSHNLKTMATPVDAGFAGPVAPEIAAKLTGWLAQVLGAG